MTVGIVVVIVLTALTLPLGGVLGWLLVGRERARGEAEALYRASEQTALTLQQSLLPVHIPDLPPCELAIRFTAAGEGDLVGGDFYDVFAVGEDRWALVIGDVCGKGAGAAAMTAMARWMLHSLAVTSEHPPRSSGRSTTPCSARIWTGGFITLVYALVDVRPDEARVTIACAGHPPAIVVSPEGKPSRIRASGDLLGVWREIRLAQVEVGLAAGEALLLHTDGVTDQGPGRGRPVEHALSGDGSSPSAEALAEALSSEAARAGGPPRDDLAIIELRYLARADEINRLALTARSATA